MHADYTVLYKYVDGAHMFTSMDPRIKGVLVMHANPKVAFEEAISQVNFLLKRDGAKGDCKPALSYEAFKTWLTKVLEQEKTPIQTIPAARINFEFNNDLVAA